MDQGFPNRYKGWGHKKCCWGIILLEGGNLRSDFDDSDLFQS